MRRDEQIAQIRKILARIDSDTNVDAGGLRVNPTEVYVDPGLAEREWEAFFRHHPQMIGLSGDLPEPGSFLTLEDFGTPVLATRDAKGTFRAFVNACRHRGTLLESRARGEARTFECPFHAWVYANDGRLAGVPKSAHFGQVDKSCLGLVELPSEERHGLLFVHPDPDGTLDVDALLGPELSEELALWDFGGVVSRGDDAYHIDCNWKLAMDTFGETYHFPALHKDTLFNGYRGNVQCYDTYGRNHRMLLVRRGIDEMRERPESEWSITEATLPVYWLFPNVQLMPGQDIVSLVRAYPVPGDPSRHVSRIGFYLRPGVDEPAELQRMEAQMTFAEAFASIIRDEDYVMSARQQQTASSGALSHVVFGRNEPALHHYHSTYRDALGMKPLPLLAEDEVGAR